MSAERVGRHGPHGEAADDAGLLVIEQRQHLRVIFGHEKRTSPELGLPVFEPVHQLSHLEHWEFSRWAICVKALPGSDRLWKVRPDHEDRLELWFDFSCPYAYLASQKAPGLARAAGCELVWKPMLLGGVFRGIGAGDGPMATLGEAKAAHNLRDMRRWAEIFGVPFQMPAAHPMRTVRALRTLLGLPHSRWPAAIAGIYAAYWQRAEDITRDEVIAAALRGCGVPDDEIAAALTGADSDAIKAE